MWIEYILWICLSLFGLCVASIFCFFQPDTCLCLPSFIVCFGGWAGRGVCLCLCVNEIRVKPYKSSFGDRAHSWNVIESSDAINFRRKGFFFGSHSSKKWYTFADVYVTSLTKSIVVCHRKLIITDWLQKFTVACLVGSDWITWKLLLIFYYIFIYLILQHDRRGVRQPSVVSNNIRNPESIACEMNGRKHICQRLTNFAAYTIYALPN